MIETSPSIHWVHDIRLSGSILYTLSLFLDRQEIGQAMLRIDREDKQSIWIDYVEIYPDWRGKGYGKELYKAISRLYHQEQLMKGKVIARDFKNRKAEHLARWALNEGLFPLHSWEETKITRLYN